MPIFPPLILPNPGLEHEALPVQRQSTSIDSSFRVEYQTVRQDFETGQMVFEGAVRAFYGPTEVICESLVLDLRTETGEANGGVRILDPEGTIRAERVTFNWAEGAKTGKAFSALIEVGGVSISASEVGVAPGVWTLRDASFTLEDLERSRTLVTAREVTIELGRRGVAKHVFFQVLGQRLGPIPSYTFNLDRRVSGLKPPTLALRGGGRVGAEWNSTVLLGDRLAFSGDASAFPGERPASNFYLVASGLAPGESSRPLRPRNDLDERFSDGYFNNIGIRTPEDERGTIRSPHLLYAVGTSANHGTRGRKAQGLNVSKNWELVGEAGGALAGFGWQGSARVQRIGGSVPGDWVNRGVVGATVLLPDREFGGFSLLTRIDGQAMGGDGNTFGFGRVETGLVSNVRSGFRFGGALVLAGEFGTPDFEFDRLNVLSGVYLRADYAKGPYTFRYLAKYDLRAGEWFDREWEVALAAGSFEPYIQRREFPDEFRFGVRLRLTEFFGRLQDREVRRVNF